MPNRSPAQSDPDLPLELRSRPWVAFKMFLAMGGFLAGVLAGILLLMVKPTADRLSDVELILWLLVCAGGAMLGMGPGILFTYRLERLADRWVVHADRIEIFGRCGLVKAVPWDDVSKVELIASFLELLCRDELDETHERMLGEHLEKHKLFFVDRRVAKQLLRMYRRRNIRATW